MNRREVLATIPGVMVLPKDWQPTYAPVPNSAPAQSFDEARRRVCEIFGLNPDLCDAVHLQFGLGGDCKSLELIAMAHLPGTEGVPVGTDAYRKAVDSEIDRMKEAIAPIAKSVTNIRAMFGVQPFATSKEKAEAIATDGVKAYVLMSSYTTTPQEGR